MLARKSCVATHTFLVTLDLEVVNLMWSRLLTKIGFGKYVLRIKRHVASEKSGLPFNSKGDLWSYNFDA